MQKDKIHVYLMPGMAASPTIFEYIKLPQETFEVHHLRWELPEKNESLENYALRLSKEIKHEKPILLGVSFGGILVQEMNKFIKPQKTIVVSSVLHESQFPMRMKFARRSKLYKLVPTKLFADVEKLAKYALGETATDRIELYKKYLSVSDKKYLDWAIDKIMNWKQSQQLENVVHIHGSKDRVFPMKYIKENVIEIENGTHVMIINKHKWFNENLPQIITV